MRFVFNLTRPQILKLRKGEQIQLKYAQLTETQSNDNSTTVVVADEFINKIKLAIKNKRGVRIFGEIVEEMGSGDAIEGDGFRSIRLKDAPIKGPKNSFTNGSSSGSGMEGDGFFRSAGRKLSTPTRAHKNRIDKKIEKEKEAERKRKEAEMSGDGVNLSKLFGNVANKASNITNTVASRGGDWLKKRKNQRMMSEYGQRGLAAGLTKGESESALQQQRTDIRENRRNAKIAREQELADREYWRKRDEEDRAYFASQGRNYEIADDYDYEFEGSGGNKKAKEKAKEFMMDMANKGLKAGSKLAIKEVGKLAKKEIKKRSGDSEAVAVMGDILVEAVENSAIDNTNKQINRRVPTKGKGAVTDLMWNLGTTAVKAGAKAGLKAGSKMAKKEVAKRTRNPMLLSLSNTVIDAGEKEGNKQTKAQIAKQTKKRNSKNVKGGSFLPL